MYNINFQFYKYVYVTEVEDWTRDRNQGVVYVDGIDVQRNGSEVASKDKG